MRILKLFPHVYSCGRAGLIGLTLGIYLWASTWPLALTLDGSDGGIALILFAGAALFATALLGPHSPAGRLPGPARALLLMVAPMAAVGLRALPIGGLAPLFAASALYGALLGLLLSGGSLTPRPALFGGLGLAALLLHVAPLPGLPLPWLALGAGLLLGLVARPGDAPRAPLDPLALTLTSALLAGALVWASHRVWMAFLTPTRSSEGIFLGCWLLAAAAGGHLLRRLSPPILLLWAAAMIALLRLLLPELPLTLGLWGLLERESWPSLILALTGVGLALTAPIALPLGGLLARGGGVAGALGLGGGLCLGVGLLPQLQAAGLIEAVGGSLGLMALGAALLGLQGLPRYGTFALGLLSILLLGMAPPLPEKLLSSALYPQLLEREGVRRSLSDARGRTPLYLAEDAFGGVAAFPGTASPSVVIAGAPQGGDAYLPMDMRFLGLLGPLLHPDPQRALVLGPRGREAVAPLDEAGVEVVAATLGAQRLAAMEIEGAGALGPLPIGTTKTTQGLDRALRQGVGRYDLVVAPPHSPWTREGALAFTRERFLAMARALRPGGMALVALPLEPLGPGALASILGAFSAAFPHTSAWLSPSGTRHLILVGADVDPLPFSYLGVLSRQNQPRLRSSLVALDLNSPGDLFARLLGGPELLAQAAEGAQIPTEGRPIFDLSLPRVAYGQPQAPALALFADRLTSVASLIDPPGHGPSEDQLTERLTRALEANRALISLLTSLGAGSLDTAVDTLLSLGPGSDREVGTLIQPYLDRARRNLSLGLLDEANAQASFARALAPHSPEPFLVIASIQLRQNQPHLAEEAYAEALRRDPSETRALLGLADLAQRSRRYGEALGHLEKARELLPTSAVIYHNLGELYRVQGQLGAARANFEQATAIDRSLARAHAGLALTLLAQGAPEAALPSAALAVRLEESAMTFETLGQVFLALKDYNRARSSLVQCLLRDPEAVPCLGGMGIVYAEEGRLDKARESWERVLDIEPENGPAQENLRRMDAQRDGARAPILTLEGGLPPGMRVGPEPEGAAGQ